MKDECNERKNENSFFATLLLKKGEPKILLTPLSFFKSSKVQWQVKNESIFSLIHYTSMSTIVDKVCVDFIIQNCCNDSKHNEVTIAWFNLPTEIVKSMKQSMDQMAQINVLFSKVTEEREQDHNKGVGSTYQEKKFKTLQKLSQDQTIHNKLCLFQIYHYMNKNQLLG